MWFFGKESEEDKAKRERQEAAVQALERGELPPVARRRIEERNNLSKSFFTSDLTCREYMLCRESGIEPISQVMGSSFFKIGYRGYYNGRWNGTGELSNLSHAQSQARRLAISRMEQEAKLLNADGIVGVRLEKRGYDWVSGVVEFTAFGTAIRIPQWKHKGELFSSDLNGQEFWQLYKSGYRPVSLVFGNCSYYIYTDYSTRAQMTSWWGGSTPNQEIDKYTQCFYKARHIAMRRFEDELQSVGAEGGVGVNFSFDMEDLEYEVNDTVYHDVLLNFTAIGTAIVEQREKTSQAPSGTLVCYDLAKGSNRLIGNRIPEDDLDNLPPDIRALIKSEDV